MIIRRIAAVIIFLTIITPSVAAGSVDITVRVRDVLGGPGHERYLSGVSVYVDGAQTAAAVSDSSGAFELSGLSAGVHRLTFIKSGYMTDSIKITCSGSTAAVDMPLVPAGVTGISDQDFYSKCLNLDYHGIESVKQAVLNGDYITANEELINYFISRKSPVWFQQPAPSHVNSSYSRTKADNIVNHIFTEYSITACPDNPPGSGNINWLYTPNGDKEWYWALNRHFHLKDLSTAYLETSDTKYANEFASEFIDWAIDNPVPSSVDTIGGWRTIEAGLRLSESMIYYFNNFLMCPAVSNQSKMAVLKSFYQHGEYLYNFSGTNNWLLFECRGLYALSEIFPEFTLAAKWKQTALTRLQNEYNRQFLPDGWQYELTPNYHMESVKTITSVQDIASLNNDSLPFAADMTKGFTAMSHVIMPGCRLNPLNDTSQINATGFMRLAADFTLSLDKAKADGFLSQATSYLAGDPGALDTSYADTWSGYLHMRDYNGSDGIYGMLETGAAGMGHGWTSRDKLQFTLSAFGRDLLVDPSIYSYAGQPVAQYMYTTAAHNTITVDGYDQSRRSQDMSHPADNCEFHTLPGMDIAKGVYNEGYDEKVRLSVEHERTVLFVKPDYFIVSDRLSGTGNHTVKQYWNFAPGAWQIDSTNKTVYTNFADGANVLLVPVDRASVTLDTAAGQTTPVYRGWSCAGGNIAVPSLNACYIMNSSLPGTMDTLVLPYKGNLPPSVTAQRISVMRAGAAVSPSEAVGLSVSGDDYTDFIIIRKQGEGQLEFAGFSFDGDAALIRVENGIIVRADKYPETSSLTSESYDMQFTTGRITYPASGAVLANDPVKLQASVTGSVQSVKFYAEYTKDGLCRRELIGTAYSAPYECTWNFSNVPQQENVKISIDIVTSNGKKITKAGGEVRGVSVFPSAHVPSVLQAEWREFTRYGAVLNLVDSAAYGRAAVQLNVGASISRRFSGSLSSLRVRAKANGSDASLNVMINGASAGYINVPAGGYNWYTITKAATDGILQIQCADGSAVLDMLELKDLKNNAPESRLVLRQRLAVSNGDFICGSSEWTDYSVQADFNLISALTMESGAEYGLLSRKTDRGTYLMHYNLSDETIEIVKREDTSATVLASAKIKLEPLKWYTLRFDVNGTSLKGRVWEQGSTMPLRAQLEASDSSFPSGNPGMTASFADVAGDNFVVTLSNGQIPVNEGLEYCAPGDLPSNWYAEGPGIWYVDDGLQLNSGGLVLSLNSDGTTFLPGSQVTFSYNTPEDIKSLALMKNCRQQAMLQAGFGQYVWNASPGEYCFQLLATMQDDTVVESEPLIISVNEETYNVVSSVTQDYTTYKGGLPDGWSGSSAYMTAVNSDASHGTCLKLSNDAALSCTEIYLRTPQEYRGKVRLETDIYLNDKSHRVPILIVRDSSGKEAYLLLFANNGNLIKQTNGTILMQYQSKKWYKCRLEMDTANGIWDFYIDGRLIVSGEKIPVPLTGIRTVYIAKIWDGNTSPGYVLLDNLNISNLQDKDVLNVVVENNAGTLLRTVKIPLPTSSAVIIAAVYNENVLKALQYVNYTAGQTSGNIILNAQDFKNLTLKTFAWTTLSQAKPLRESCEYFVENNLAIK